MTPPDFAGKKYLESTKPNTLLDFIVTLIVIGVFVAQVLSQI